MMFFGGTLRDTVRSLSRKPSASPPSPVEDRNTPIDITRDFVTWLRKGATDPEFSFMALINGTGGAGKTTLAMMIANVLLSSDKSRTLALWNTPESLEKAIKKQLKVYLPESDGDGWAKRVITIKKVKDIQKDYIVLVDEGVLNMNAKRALNDDMVEFEKMITIARHLRIVILMNSIFQSGVAKSFRVSSQLKIYKLMPIENIKEFDSDFVKHNIDLLTKLKKPEALIQCSHPKFMRSGYIYMDLLDYCPWYNMEISQSMGASGTADFGKDKRAEMEERIRVVSDEAMESLGSKLGLEKSDKWCNQQILRAWLRENKLEEYDELEKQVSKIIDTIKYKLLFIGQSRDMSAAANVLAPASRQSVLPSMNDQQDTLHPRPPAMTGMLRDTGDLLSDGFDYGQFFYDCAVSQQYDEKSRLLAKLTMQGYTLVQMCDHPLISMSETWVTNVRSDMNNNWFGYWAEWAWARVIGVEPNREIYGNRPDLIIDEERTYMGVTFGAGTIFSIKFKIEKATTLKFTQWTEGDDRGDLDPEYQEALARGTGYYIVVLNPRWSVNHFYLKEIDPNGLRTIEVRKPRGRNNDAVLLP